MRARSAIAVVTVFVGGCVTTPQFESMSGVTPSSVIDVIQCELVQTKSYFRGWTAVADLTFQVNEQLTLAPSFTHTDVVSKSLTRIFDWGLKFDTQSSRIYSETITLDLDSLVATKWCDAHTTQGTQGVSLNGNLGLVEVIKMGLGSIDAGDLGVRHGAEKKAAFGTTIEFELLKAVSASGPTWTLSHFKGPGKLFSTQRNDTHKLAISFSKKAGLAINAATGAAAAASAQNDKMNIQGLTSAIKQLRHPN